tara:strand:+ start:518 stop:955 length:438 start_codon:yes stop_codon:yes gene_type:complete
LYYLRCEKKSGGLRHLSEFFKTKTGNHYTAAHVTFDPDDITDRHAVHPVCNPVDFFLWTDVANLENVVKVISLDFANDTVIKKEIIWVKLAIKGSCKVIVSASSLWFDVLKDLVNHNFLRWLIAYTINIMLFSELSSTDSKIISV